ncbi:hypothetical protein V6Z12_A04G036000 [Gossypium hirsutum]
MSLFIVYFPVGSPLHTLRSFLKCLARGICKIASVFSLVNKKGYKHPARWIYNYCYPLFKPFHHSIVSSSPIHFSKYKKGGRRKVQKNSPYSYCHSRKAAIRSAICWPRVSSSASMCSKHCSIVMGGRS